MNRYRWEVGWVKATIGLPDGLFRRAKAAAATRGITLEELMAEAVERRLREVDAEQEEGWKGLHGALSSLRRETRRVQARIDQEFENVDEGADG